VASPCPCRGCTAAYKQAIEDAKAVAAAVWTCFCDIETDTGDHQFWCPVGQITTRLDGLK
jgi:hypothetical protein